MIRNRYNLECSAGSAWFADCCGARYRPKATVKTLYAPFKGIRVAPGKIGVARKLNKNSLHHVETKNGFITIKIREKW